MGHAQLRSNDLDDCVDKLNQLRLPVVARTAQDISKAVSDADSSAVALARIIMRDASMSATVLRIANSSFHRSSGPPICTVSRAVVKLGFESIRAISRSVSVIEALLKGEKRERVLREIAHAFHAATQARSLAEQIDANSGEDVFVAALLYRIGRVAFWSLPAEMTRQLEAALAKRPDADPADVEKDVLGFTLHDLTQRLSTEWDLGPTLNKALKTDVPKQPVLASIPLGHRVAAAVEHGWDSAAYNEVAEQIAKRLNIATGNVRKLLEQNAKHAVDNAKTFGFARVGRWIPAPTQPEAAPEALPDLGAATDHQPEPTYLEADPGFQLECLRELAAVAEENPSVGQILNQVLEGLYRGLGADRALFALLTPDRALLRGKLALGIGGDQLCEHFAFPVKSANGAANLFGRLLQTRQALFVPSEPPKELRALLPERVLAITGRNGFYAAPILVGDKPIGLFYADRQPSGRPLDQDGFRSFRCFAQQANLALMSAGGTAR